MAFATKFRIEGTSDVYGKITVNIKEDGYAGSVINLEGASRDFVTLKIGSPTNNISQVVLPGEANIQFYALTEFQTIEFAQTQPFTYLVEINDGLSENIWTGWIMPEQYSESYTNTPYLVNVIASDCLDVLKNVSPASFTGTKTTLWNAIRTALAGTRLELRYLESVSIYSDEMDANNQDSPFTQAEVINTTFNGFTCYDILEGVLKPFFARVYQYRGWRIENITEKRDNHTVRLFNIAGVYQSFFNSNSLVQLDNSPANFSAFIQKSGQLNFQPALNYSSSYFPSIQRIEATGLNGFDKLTDWTDSNNLVSWTNENSISIQRVVTEYNGSEYGVWIDGANSSFSADQYIQSTAIAVDPTDNQNITIGFDYKMDYPSVIILGSKPMLYVEFFLDGTLNDYYWTGTQWVTDRKTVRISASPRNSWRSFQANIGILPEAGDLYIRIHKLVKSGTVGVTKLFLTRFYTNIEVESEESNVYLFAQATTAIEAIFRGPSFELKIADGLIPEANGVIEVSTVLTDNWNRAGETDNLPLTSLFLYQWLSYHQYAGAILQGTLYQKGEKITPYSTIEDDPSISTKRYILNLWELSLGSGRGNVQFREIPKTDEVTTIITGTRTEIEQNDYLIPGVGVPTGPNVTPELTPTTPTITFDNIRFLNGDVTGDISTAELTPSAIVNKARLDTTALTGDDIVFNAVKDTPDQENMTNLRLSDTYPILDETFVPYTGAKSNVDLGEKGLDTGFITFDTTPTGTPTDQGTAYWDADDNTVAIIMNGAIQKVGEDSFYPVKNQTGSTINKGVNVRFAGTVGNSGRLLIEPFLADGTYDSSTYMGVTMEEIANGDDGKVMWFGRIRGINTNAFNEGDILYASTTSAGGFQTTAPVAPNNIVQVAAVVTKSVNQGTIFVRPKFVGITGSGTTNYIPKFTGALAIGNSQIIDNGTNVLVKKTVDNGNSLQVSGNIHIGSGDLLVENLRGLYYDSDNRVKTDSGFGWEISSWTKTLFKKNVEIENQIYSPVNAKGNSGSGTITFNWNDSNIQSITLTDDCTFAFSNPQSGGSYQIIVTQDGTGGRVVTLPSVTWQGGSAPTLPTGANNKYILRLYYDGSVYYGELVGYYAGGSFITDAPNDGLFYARKSQAWAKLHGLAADVTGGVFPASPLYIDPADGNIVEVYSGFGQVVIDGIKKGYEGRNIFIWSNSNYAEVVLNNNSGSVSASDRFELSASTYVSLANFRPIHLIYIDSRWRVVNS